jgi:CheY-like chemotaxis protein
MKIRPGCRVLVVDDNVGLAENIAEFLENEGYLTEVAASAEEALPRACAGDVDVVIADFRLPGLSGADLVARLREARTPFLAVVISAHNDQTTVEAARAAGATFLAKPIDLGRLGRYLSDATGMA